MNLDERVEGLLEYRENIRPQQLFPTLKEEAAELIEEDPFAFVLAGSIDRGTKAEIIWTIPYYIEQQIGRLDPKFFAESSLENIEEIFGDLPKQPRYIDAAPRTVKELSVMIMDQFHGDAEEIWKDRTAKQVMDSLESIYGIGPGISSMIVNILNQRLEVEFEDLDEVDIKGDIQLGKVFKRLGLIDEEDPEKAVEKARRSYPEYPGKLDASAWIIGREYCHRSSPDCSSCQLNKVCERNI